MPLAACGISCDVCGLYVQGICSTCFAGTDERVQKKLDEQMQAINMYCPILACAVEKKVGYCPRDCPEFPCVRFQSGFEAVQGAGPFPYSTSFLNMFRRRIGRE
jgi:hypothetical protein